MSMEAVSATLKAEAVEFECAKANAIDKDIDDTNKKEDTNKGSELSKKMSEDVRKLIEGGGTISKENLEILMGGFKDELRRLNKEELTDAARVILNDFGKLSMNDNEIKIADLVEYLWKDDYKDVKEVKEVKEVKAVKKVKEVKNDLSKKMSHLVKCFLKTFEENEAMYHLMAKNKLKLKCDFFKKALKIMMGDENYDEVLKLPPYRRRILLVVCFKKMFGGKNPLDDESIIEFVNDFINEFDE